MPGSNSFKCPTGAQLGQQPCGDGITAAQAAQNLCASRGKAVVSFAEVPHKACSNEYGEVNVCCK